MQSIVYTFLFSRTFKKIAPQLYLFLSGNSLIDETLFEYTVCKTFVMAESYSHLFYVVSSYVHHFIAIGQFNLELRSWFQNTDRFFGQIK